MISNDKAMADQNFHRGVEVSQVGMMYDFSLQSLPIASNEDAKRALQELRWGCFTVEGGAFLILLPHKIPPQTFRDVGTSSYIMYCWLRKVSAQDWNSAFEPKGRLVLELSMTKIHFSPRAPQYTVVQHLLDIAFYRDRRRQVKELL